MLLCKGLSVQVTPRLYCFFFDNAVQNTLLMFSHKTDCMLKVLETAIDVLSKLLKRRYRFRFRVMVFDWGLWLVFRVKV